jgi:hypothetical protein
LIRACVVDPEATVVQREIECTLAGDFDGSFDPTVTTDHNDASVLFVFDIRPPAQRNRGSGKCSRIERDHNRCCAGRDENDSAQFRRGDRERTADHWLFRNEDLIATCLDRDGGDNSTVGIDKLHSLWLDNGN